MSRSRPSSSSTAASSASKNASRTAWCSTSPPATSRIGETLLEAVVRETREETAWLFEPEALVGHLPVAQARPTAAASCASPSAARSTTTSPQQPLDRGIVRALWLSHEQLAGAVAAPAHRRWSCAASMTTCSASASRSMSVACLDLDNGRPGGLAPSASERRRAAYNARHVRGAQKESSSACPAASIPPWPRCCSSAQGYDVHGLFMSNWEDDDAYCTGAAGFPGCARRRPRARHSAAPGELRRTNIARTCSNISSPSTAPAARRIPTCCATARSSSASASTTRAAGRAAVRHRPLRAPRAQRRGGPCCSRRATPTRTSPTSCTPSRANISRACCCRSASCTKTEVRELAREAGLPVFDKPDSTGICFIGERPFREFLARYIPTTPGDIVHRRRRGGRAHRGLAFYTLGQRGGLDIGGRAGAARRAVVCGRQGSRAQRTAGRAGARSSAARRAVHWPPGPATGWCNPPRSSSNRSQGALSPGRPGLPRDGRARMARSKSVSTSRNAP